MKSMGKILLTVLISTVVNIGVWTIMSKKIRKELCKQIQDVEREIDKQFQSTYEEMDKVLL